MPQLKAMTNPQQFLKLIQFYWDLRIDMRPIDLDGIFLQFLLKSVSSFDWNINVDLNSKNWVLHVPKFLLIRVYLIIKICRTIAFTYTMLQQT